jgi:hypothetical protein
MVQRIKTGMIADDAVTAAKLSTDAENISVFRNRIINGAMVIDQRNAGASVTNTAGAQQYPVDRWFTFGTQASKFTAQQNAGSVTPPAGFTNYLGITSLSAYSSGAGEAFGIAQYIEGFNFADLDWGTANAKTITISFWVRSSLTGTFGGSLMNGAQNRSYPYSYTISSANTWEQKSVTITGDTTGTWLKTNGTGLQVWTNIGSGSSLSGTAGSWSGSTFTSTTGAVSVVGTSGATFYITGVQLEVGTQATSFEYRQYGTELALCERYYQIVDYNGGPINTYVSSNAGYTTSSISEMRAAPTVTFDTAIPAAGSIYSSAGNFVCAYSTNQPSTVRSVSWAATRNSGVFAAGEVCAHTYVRLRNSAEL